MNFGCKRLHSRFNLKKELPIFLIYGRIDLTMVKSIQLNSPDGELNVPCTLNYFVAKLTFGQLQGEFNLAVSKKQFSYRTE